MVHIYVKYMENSQLLELFRFEADFVDYPVISNVPVHFREPETSENPASLDFTGFIISFYMKCDQNRFLQIC